MQKFREFLSDGNSLWRHLFSFLVELDFPENEELRHLVIENMIDVDDNTMLFGDYICYINNEDVEYHLDARIRLLQNRINKPEFRDFCYKYVQEIRDIDEGNLSAINYKLALDLGCDCYIDDIVRSAIYHQDIFINALEER